MPAIQWCAWVTSAGIELGEFVTVQGWLGEYRDMRQINCQSVVTDPDPNAECYSWLRTIQLGRDVYSKRGGGGSSARVGRPAGGDGAVPPTVPPTVPPPGASLAYAVSAAAAASAAASAKPPTMTLARLKAAASAGPADAASPASLEKFLVHNGVETVTAAGIASIASAIPGICPLPPARAWLLESLVAAGVVFAAGTATSAGSAVPGAAAVTGDDPAGDSAVFTVVCNPTVLGPVLVRLIGSRQSGLGPDF